VAAVAGPVNLRAQGALQAESHLGDGPAQKAAGIQGVSEQASGLAAPHGHRQVADPRAQDGPDFIRGLTPINRHLMASRSQTPGQVLHGGLGPARAPDPLSQEGDTH
jgi:hypothetical protein